MNTVGAFHEHVATTLLGVCVLSMGRSEWFRVFVKLTAAVIVLHGVIFLPMLLSRLGLGGLCKCGEPIMVSQ